METPIRDQIRLDNLWQAQRISPQSRRVFIPAPLAGTEFQLIPGKGVLLAEQPLTFKFGTWNRLEGTESLDGVRLVASPPSHISRIECSHTSNGLFVVQTDLNRAQVCTLHVTLSAANGQQVASARQQVREHVDRVRTDLNLPFKLDPGSYRLKVVLVVGDQITDNARVEVSVSS